MLRSFLFIVMEMHVIGLYSPKDAQVRKSLVLVLCEN